MIFAVVIFSLFASIFAQEYPVYRSYLEPALNVSVARMTQSRVSDAIYFCSPANGLFNFPEGTPAEAIYKWENPVESFSQLEVPRITKLNSGNMEFPNLITPVPEQFDFFQSEEPLLATSGRFPIAVVEEQLGEMAFIDGDNFITISGTPSEDNAWYYFDVHFYDVNGDGLLDILSGRQVQAPNLPPFGFFWNQLVWFEHPQENPEEGNWKVHVLTNPNYSFNSKNEGPSTSFDFTDIDNDGIPEMVAAEFWNSQLILVYTETGDWSDASSLKTVVIENDLGNIYAVQFGDFNYDGKYDVIATNHADVSDVAAVAIYQIPSDFKTNSNPSFTRHIVDTNFPTRWTDNSFAPGYAKIFSFPNLNQKPMIVVSSDGGGDWFLYRPISQSATDFTYEREFLGGNDCDFIAPLMYQPSARNQTILAVGCLGLGLVYGGEVISVN